MAFSNNLIRASVTLAHHPLNPTAGPVPSPGTKIRSTSSTAVYATVQYIELKRNICLLPEGNLSVVGESLHSSPTARSPFYLGKCNIDDLSFHLRNMLNWFGISDPETTRVLARRIMDLTATRDHLSRMRLNLVLRKIDDIVFDKMADLAGEDCAICLVAAAGVIAAEMPCRHRFHSGCIASWLKRSRTCPLCRFELPLGTSIEAAYRRFADATTEPELSNVSDGVSILEID